MSHGHDSRGKHAFWDKVALNLGCGLVALIIFMFTCALHDVGVIARRLSDLDASVRAIESQLALTRGSNEYVFRRIESALLQPGSHGKGVETSLVSTRVPGLGLVYSHYLATNDVSVTDHYGKPQHKEN